MGYHGILVLVPYAVVPETHLVREGLCLLEIGTVMQFLRKWPVLIVQRRTPQWAITTTTKIPSSQGQPPCETTQDEA